MYTIQSKNYITIDIIFSNKFEKLFGSIDSCHIKDSPSVKYIPAKTA